MPAKGTPHFGNVLLCEDVRIEVNNKHTIVGTLSGDIMIAQVPSTMEIAAYIEFYPEGTNVTLIFRLMFAGYKMADINVQPASAPPGTPVIAVIPRGQLGMNQEGELRIDAQISGGKWRTILKKQVTV